MRIRQLLQAHKAAAAAAAAAARAGAASPTAAGATAGHQANQAATSISMQGAADLRPEKLPSRAEFPEAAAAGASGGAGSAAGAASARQLDWGDVDIQRIVAMDPVLVMVGGQDTWMTLGWHHTTSGCAPKCENVRAS